jgi:probable HAF family extracellular repeat protein
MKKSCQFVLLFFAAGIFSVYSSAQSYTVTDLGSLAPGGIVDVSFGYALNSLGEVVGSSYTPQGLIHAFLWTPASGISDLGTFGGQTSIAWGINDSQQVVGQADLASGFTHAFLRTSRQGMQDLGTLGGPSSYAHAINRLGQVVGEAFRADGNDHAFLWTQAGGMIDLGTLGGSQSVAYAVNDLGQVVGSSSTAGEGSTHAFLWTQQRGMRDLGVIKSYLGSLALGINHLGQVVAYSGTMELYQYTYGFEWNSSQGRRGIPFFPGSIQTFPMGINDANVVTGQFNDSQGFANAFVYSKAAGIHNLNQFISASSGWTLSIGTAISQLQQITGYGIVLTNGVYLNHAYLLTPQP